MASNTNILATSGIGQLMAILQEHLEIIHKKDAAVEQMISTAQTAESLRQAKKVALDNEKNLLLSILKDIGEMNTFLENIILIENLFNSVYQPHKKQQEEARAKYAPNIAQYESKPKVQSEAASFVELIFGGQTHISSFKTWLTKVEKQCKIQNIHILKSSGANVKQIERAFYKAHYVYDEQDGFKEMTDILRCSFVFDNFSDLYQCFSVIETLAEQTLGGVLRVKDRYHPTTIPFGYRDLLINVFCPSSKIVAEIQLHFIEFYKYKKISHTMYKTARLFEREETNEAYEYATKYKRPKIGTFKVYKVSNEEMEDDEKGDDEEEAKEGKQAKDMKYNELLKQWGLDKYAQKMKEEGWDDPADWKEIEDDDLKNDIGFSKGHIKKFRRKYTEWLKQIESENIAIYQEQVYDNKQPKRRLSKMKQDDEKQAGFTPGDNEKPYKPGDHISDGDTIIVRGDGMKNDADRWTVNLFAGNNHALHFNPRPFTEGQVVRNAKINNNWGVEERGGGLQVAADKNAAIAVEFKKTPTKWEITYNGKRIPAYDFSHRVTGGITNVQTLGIKGNVTVHVEQAGLTRYKPGDRISDGDTIIVKGDGMTKDANQWAVNLFVGNNYAFHFNPRPCTEGQVVRNAKINNNWGVEERGGGLQVAADKNAAIAVEFKKTPTKWEVTYNGKRIPAYDFAHRVTGSITNVQSVGIKGNVTVYIQRCVDDDEKLNDKYDGGGVAIEQFRAGSWDDRIRQTLNFINTKLENKGQLIDIGFTMSNTDWLACIHIYYIEKVDDMKYFKRNPADYMNHGDLLCEWSRYTTSWMGAAQKAKVFIEKIATAKGKLFGIKHGCGNHAYTHGGAVIATFYWSGIKSNAAANNAVMVAEFRKGSWDKKLKETLEFVNTKIKNKGQILDISMTMSNTDWMACIHVYYIKEGAMNAFGRNPSDYAHRGKLLCKWEQYADSWMKSAGKMKGFVEEQALKGKLLGVKHACGNHAWTHGGATIFVYHY